MDKHLTERLGSYAAVISAEPKKPVRNYGGRRRSLPRKGANPEALLKAADAAMYGAKVDSKSAVELVP